MFEPQLLDLHNPPKDFIRVVEDNIPKYLISAAADVVYDFYEATYFIYNKASGKIQFAIHIEGQQDSNEFNESTWL